MRSSLSLLSLLSKEDCTVNGFGEYEIVFTVDDNSLTEDDGIGGDDGSKPPPTPLTFSRGIGKDGVDGGLS